MSCYLPSVYTVRNKMPPLEYGSEVRLLSNTADLSGAVFLNVPVSHIT